MSTPADDSSTTRIRVATYNVLSSSLCSKEYYEYCDPKVVANKARWSLVKETVIAQASTQTIICLQEISMTWTCRLHKLFEELDYQFIPCNYGSAFNGYMGVSIAFPRSVYELIDCEIVRVSDTKSGGFPREPWSKGPPSITAALSVMWSAVGAYMPKLSSSKDDGERVVDQWKESERRYNRMVMVKLSVKGEEVNEEGEKVAPKEICVGTYHMPCAFWAPKVMTIHSALAAQKMEKFSEDSPLVLCGDWNFKPFDPQFKMITEGDLVSTDAAHPGVCFEGDKWEPKMRRSMQSAYTAVNGNEPVFTNYGYTRGMPEPFIETLDYLFFSAGAKQNGRAYNLKCVSVDDTPDKDATIAEVKSYPSATQASDHVLIAAEWELSIKE